MNLTLFTTLGSALIFVGLGVILALRQRDSAPGERSCLLLLPITMATTAFVAWAAFRLVPHWTWSAARLAASTRIALGIPLYTGPQDAMVNGWIYGPVSAIAYLPATLASDPLAALRIASVLNAFYFVLPLFALLVTGLRSAPSQRPTMFLFGAGLAALLAPFATWYGAAALSSDTVAVALGSASCIVLARSGRSWLAAVWLALAVWTKQIEAPLLVAQMIYLGTSRGLRPAMVHAGWCLLAGVALALLFSAWFGGANLWYCMVEVPRRHPVAIASAGGHLLAFLKATWWGWLLGVLAWRSRAPDSARIRFHRQIGGLLLLTSLVLLPGGIVAAAKAGGDQNSIHSIPYAILGGISFVASFLAEPQRNLRTSLILIGGAALALAVDLHRILANDHLALAEPGLQHREAFAFARAHPGQVYYPCNPLISLMAEKRNYPFDYGLYDWKLANAAPSATEIRKQVPPTVTFVVFHEKDPSHEMLRLLSEFNQLRQSGPWDIYTRPTLPPPSESASREAH